jgi:hypothetical protein
MSLAKIVYEDIAVGAEDDATITSENDMSFSNPQNLLIGVTPKKICTCEHNEWGLSSNYQIYSGDAVAFWSTALSDSNCAFATGSLPTITITFTGVYTTLGLSFDFAKEIDNYIQEFKITWYKDTTQLATQTFTNTNTSYCAMLTVQNYNKIVIEVTKTQLPLTRAKINKLFLGIIRTFEMDELRNVSIQQECDPISNTVSASTMTWTLNSLKDIDYIFQSKQPCKAYDGDNLIGVYYIKNSNKKDARLYEINSEDALGVLDYKKFSAKIYTGSTTVLNDLTDIIGSDFKIDLDSSFASINTPIGYIPDCTCREAIQQICFAIGASITTMDSDKIVIRPSDTSNPDILLESEIFRGSSVETSDKITQVVVTAHSLTSDTSGDVDIGGTKYKDIKTTKTINNPNIVSSDKPNIVTVDNMTLINPTNLDTVATRVYNYTVRRSKMSAKIILGTHQVGDYVQLPTKWGDNVTGNITSMSITLSNLTVADCDILGE